MPQYSPEAEHGKHTLLAADPEQKTPEDKATQSLHAGVQELTARIFCECSVQLINKFSDKKQAEPNKLTNPLSHKRNTLTKHRPGGLIRWESGEQATDEEQSPGDTSTISQRGRNQLQMAQWGWCPSPQLKSITDGLVTHLWVKASSAPGKGWLDGGLSQTFFRVYSNAGCLGIFRVTARTLLWDSGGCGCIWKKKVVDVWGLQGDNWQEDPVLVQELYPYWRHH